MRHDVLRPLPLLILCALTPTCVAEGPPAAPAPAGAVGSLLTRAALTRAASDDGAALVFPPEDDHRRARPPIGGGPTEGGAGAPDVEEPESGSTVDVLGGRMRIALDRPMARPKATPATKGRVAAAPGTVTITPSVKHRVEWIDAMTLEWIAEEPLVTGQKYTVTLGDLRSESGQPLKPAWTVTAIPRVAVAGKILGYAPKPGAPRVVAMHPHDGATVGPSPEIAVLYDQPIDLDRARSLLSLAVDKGAKVPFAASHPLGPTFQGVPVDPRFVVLMRPTAPLARGKKHWLRAAAPEEGGSGSSMAFTVAEALAITGLECPFGADDTCVVNGATIDVQGREIAIRANNPIAMTSAQLGKLLQITPPVRNLSIHAHGWDSGRIEVTGELEPSTRYDLTLVGLVDRHGSRIAAPFRAVIESAPREASVTMASGVLMLDAERMKRFAVTSRNVDDAVLSFWPVGDDVLDTAVTNVRAGIRPEGAPPIELPVPVAARENELVTTEVDLTGVLDEGRAYMATVRSRNTAFGAESPRERSGPVALLFPGGADSLAVHAERIAGRTLVHVARLATGEPVAGAKIDLLRGPMAAPIETGADGLAVLGSSASGLLSVSAGGARTVVDLRRADTTAEKLFSHLASGASEEDAALRGVLFTDRGIYRPGATVHVFANARQADGVRLVPLAGAGVIVRALGPSGDEVFRAPATTNDLGSVSASFDVAKGAKLGRHRVVVELADDEVAEDEPKTIAETIVQVAEFEAPRFAVDVDASATSAGSLRANVAARYLFGAPMDGAKVKWTARREAAAITEGPFAGGGFSFRPSRERWDERPKAAAWSRAGEATAGADGTVRIDQRLSLDGAVGPQRFVVEAEVTDASNRAVAGRASAVAHPAGRYAGLRVAKRWTAPGAKLPVDLAVVDRDGEAVAGASVSAVLSRVVYTYITRRNAGGAVTEEWTRRELPAGRCTAQSTARGATCELAVPAEGTYEIAAEVDGRRGGSTTAWAFSGSSGAGSGAQGPGRGRALDLVADRASYAPGDTAKVFVTSPFEAATAIISTDAPGSVPRTERILGSAGVIEIPVGAEDAPHVHAVVTLLPLSASKAGEPGGASGERPAASAPPDYRFSAIRLPVATSGARLALAAVPAKASYRPGETAQIDLRVTDGERPVAGAQIAIAVVDEGVLRMTGYHAPDPVTELRPGRALAADVFDSRTALADLVAQSHVAGDGDDGGKTPSTRGGRRGETARSLTEARKRFADTAFWKPDVLTDDDGRATVRFPLPDNLTDFRIMAVVLEREGKGAVTESSFTVQKPLLLAPALPRFVSLGDRFEAAALVHNNTDEAAMLTVALAGKEQRLLVPARGHVRAAFPVHVTCTVPGSDDVDDTDDDVDDDASDGADEDDDAIRVCPTSKDDAPARAHLGFEARAADGTRLDAVEHELPATFAALDERPRLNGAFVKSRTVALRVPSRAVTSDAEDTLVIALGAQMWPELGDRMRYLLEYPHGCVEQTTSRTLPLLAARDIAPRIGMTEVSDADLRDKIRAGIERLGTMRTSRGGLAYWPGGTEPNVYGTAYAMRAMVLAKAAGIEPPADLIDGMAAYLVERMNGYGLEPEVRAAIAQSLAELGKLDRGAADTLFDGHEKLSVFGAASLALALSALPGQADRVATLLDQVEAAIDEAGELRRAPSEDDFHYYGSPGRTKAQAAVALRRLRPASPALPPLIRSLSESAAARAYTTQATAYSLLALAEEVRSLAAGAAGAEVLLDGRALTASRDLPGGGKEYEIPIADLAGREATLEMHSESAGAIGFAMRAAWRRPARQVASSAFQTQRGPAVYRVYTDPKGGPVDLTKVRAGDVLRVAMVVRRPPSVEPSRFGYVALTDRLPAGFEPVQQDLATVAAQPDVDASHPLAAWFRHADEHPSFLELRDDRVNVYFDSPQGDDLIATYLVRATTPGTFDVAPATAELMYEPESIGATEPSRVTIR